MFTEMPEVLKPFIETKLQDLRLFLGCSDVKYLGYTPNGDVTIIHYSFVPPTSLSYVTITMPIKEK